VLRVRLGPGVTAAFTTRAGGTSDAPYATLNLATHVGDDADVVASNRKTAAAALGLDAGRVTWCAQVHGDAVATVESGDAGRTYDATDGLVTKATGVPLAVLGADCVLVLLVAVFVFLHVVLRSSFGRALQGIRSNEHRMRSLGFPVYWYKLASFTLAGTIAGLAGYLSALQFGFVNPELLSWHQSGNVLLMLILGGVGSLYGAVVGAFAFVALTEIFQALTNHWQLLLGAAIILLVIFLPGGLASVAGRFRRTLVGEADDA